MKALPQKQLVLEHIAIARQRWEKSGVKFPDFLSDRDAFYKSVKLGLMPVFIKAGGKEAIFLEAIREYAREDWIRSGFDEKEFDRKFKSAKWRASTTAWLAGLSSILAFIIAGILRGAFSGMGDDGAIEIFIIFFGVMIFIALIFVVAGVVGWAKSRLKNDDYVTSLKLN